MINNTNVENTYMTTGILATVYPIGFQGAVTDSGTPHLKVMLKRGDGLSSRELIYNVDYELAQEEVEQSLDESMATPPVIGIKLLTEEVAAYGSTLTITRKTPFVQMIDFQVGRIDPEQVEEVADTSVLRDQELSHKFDIVTEMPEDHEERISDLEEAVDDINDLIPAQATDVNQLADKNFVNSSIATNTATFRGTYASLADLEAVTADENDYGFVTSVDTAGNTVYSRYKYTTATTPASWVFEYALNNSSFTSAQWAAINSGVTATTVAKANSLPVVIKGLNVDPATGVITFVPTSTPTTVTVKTLFGGVTIPGTVASSGGTTTFTPTTPSDTITGEWTIEVE